MNHSFTTFAKTLASLGAPLLFVALSTAARADAPAYVRVRNIAYAGTGCPAGSVAEDISPDQQAFTLLFDQYVAQTGPGVPFVQKRMNCQLNIDLDFPAGWSYSLFSVDTRGYVDLDPGVTALEQSSYYFQGSAQTATMTTNMTGPLDKDYALHDDLAVSALVWSPCGAERALNINTQVRANSFNPNANGLITVDSIDGQFKLIYGLKWQRCH
jgi:hypothetical protein